MNLVSVSPPTGALIAHLSDAAGLILVDRVIENFGMSKTQLAETAGIASDSLFKSTRSRSSKTQSRLREMLEIVARVEDWAGGPQQAMSWYRAQPIPAFGGRTAEALVKEGRAVAVREYLDHVALGGFA
jgi:predicted transcriptional regulator